MLVTVEEKMKILLDLPLGLWVLVIHEPVQRVMHEGDAQLRRGEVGPELLDLIVPAEPELAFLLVLAARPGGVEPGNADAQMIAELNGIGEDEALLVSEQMLVAISGEELRVILKPQHVALPVRIGGAALVDKLIEVGIRQVLLDGLRDALPPHVVIPRHEIDAAAWYLRIERGAHGLEEIMRGLKLAVDVSVAVVLMPPGGVASEEEEIGMQLVLFGEKFEIVDQGLLHPPRVPFAALAGMKVGEMQPGDMVGHETMGVLNELIATKKKLTPEKHERAFRDAIEVMKRRECDPNNRHLHFTKSRSTSCQKSHRAGKTVVCPFSHES